MNWNSLVDNGSFMERFLRAILPVQKLVGTFNTLVATATSTDVTVSPDGSIGGTSHEFPVDGFMRITGVVRADQALTINIFQGNISGALDTKTAIAASAGSATAGSGTVFSVEVVASLARIQVVNASGSTLTIMNLAAYLRSM